MLKTRLVVQLMEPKGHSGLLDAVEFVELLCKSDDPIFIWYSSLRFSHSSRIISLNLHPFEAHQ